MDKVTTIFKTVELDRHTNSYEMAKELGIDDYTDHLKYK